MENNDICENDIVIFMKMLEGNTTLQKLYIGNNHAIVSAENVISIIDSIGKTKLVEFSISIPDDKIHWKLGIENALKKNAHLTELDNNNL